MLFIIFSNDLLGVLNDCIDTVSVTNLNIVFSLWNASAIACVSITDLIIPLLLTLFSAYDNVSFKSLINVLALSLNDCIDTPSLASLTNACKCINDSVVVTVLFILLTHDL